MYSLKWIIYIIGPPYLEITELDIQIWSYFSEIWTEFYFQSLQALKFLLQTEATD